MGCSKCGRKPPVNKKGVMDGYRWLPDRQIKARLEVYKKRYCNDCDDKYECDYEMYNKCRNKE